MPSVSTVQNSSTLTGRAKSMLQWQPETGAISPVRRTFILFVTFDLILTFILWVIYTQVNNINCFRMNDGLCWGNCCHIWALLSANSWTLQLK